MDEMEMWEINESFCRACKDASYGQMNLSKIRKYLEDGANPNYRTKYDMCALDWSICCDVDGTIFNNGGLLDLLVEFGADVNTKDNCGRPLLFSTSSAEGVEAVLRHGAIADLTDKEGNTALFHHASEGNSEAVKLLLNHGVEVNHRNNSGNTALHWVAHQEGDLSEIAKLLIESGAELDAKNNSGKSPVDLARERGNENTLAIIDAHYENALLTERFSAPVSMPSKKMKL